MALGRARFQNPLSRHDRLPQRLRDLARIASEAFARSPRRGHFSNSAGRSHAHLQSARAVGSARRRESCSSICRRSNTRLRIFEANAKAGRNALETRARRGPAYQTRSPANRLLPGQSRLARVDLQHFQSCNRLLIPAGRAIRQFALGLRHHVLHCAPLIYIEVLGLP